MRSLFYASLLLLLSFPVRAEELSGPVTHVRDADTIEVNRTPIRLNGITAPELDTREGQQGKVYLKSLLRNKQVSCKLNGQMTHDRYVGICFLDGEDLGALIVKAGHAADCPRYSGGRYKSFETSKARGWKKPPYCKSWRN